MRKRSSYRSFHRCIRIFSNNLLNIQVSAIGLKSSTDEEEDFFGIGKVTEVFHLPGVIPAARQSSNSPFRQFRNQEKGSCSLDPLEDRRHERGSANTLRIRICRPSMPQFF